MYDIGAMAMPADFKYRDVYLKGRPMHERYDDFSIRHPKMDAGKRAKLFAPFDALRGFNFAISRKDVRYEEHPELSPEDERNLNRRLDYLHCLTFNTRLARQSCPMVTVTFFSPCIDANHDAFGKRGMIKSISGICRMVDPDITKTIRIDDTVITFDQLISIESSGNLFAKESMYEMMEGA